LVSTDISTSTDLAYIYMTAPYVEVSVLTKRESCQVYVC
jgi:hypothetical protein